MELDSLDAESIFFLSQQPHEMFANILHPEYKYMVEFLERDYKYNSVFINPLVKKQMRSKSVDLRLEWVE